MFANKPEGISGLGDMLPARALVIHQAMREIRHGFGMDGRFSQKAILRDFGLSLKVIQSAKLS